jgi:hypothetical protein
MTYFTIGVEDHYGWANLVSVAASGPDITVIDKRRVDLISLAQAIRSGTLAQAERHCQCQTR